ncbi:YxiG family protein [Wukongibacter sp. M2B1]|uniref:YxiG family protein n=1 Tax=Wukongibacter sp. M2B1 TaxID=3088895 RepID=UPI003D7B8E10
MSESKLTPLLDSLRQSIIEKFDINISKEKISIHIRANDSAVDEVKVTFEEVFSFYFINEKGNLSTRSCFDYTKLNSIGYYENGVGEFANLDCPEDEITEKDISLPNFALELLNSSMFIEARSIKINDKKFRVGYPSI